MQSIGISIQLTVTSFVCLLSYIFIKPPPPHSLPLLNETDPAPALPLTNDLDHHQHRSPIISRGAMQRTVLFLGDAMRWAAQLQFFFHHSITSQFHDPICSYVDGVLLPHYFVPSLIAAR